jgi:hypothetical protein
VVHSLTVDPNDDYSSSPNFVHDAPVDEYDQQLTDSQQTQLYTYIDRVNPNTAETVDSNNAVGRPVRRTRHQQPARFTDFHCYTLSVDKIDHCSTVTNDKRSDKRSTMLNLRCTSINKRVKMATTTSEVFIHVWQCWP